MYSIYKYKYNVDPPHFHSLGNRTPAFDVQITGCFFPAMRYIPNVQVYVCKTPEITCSH